MPTTIKQRNPSQKVALITGAMHGIGKATAIRFAKAGYNIVMNYHSTDMQVANKTAQEISEQYHVDVMSIRADISNEHSIKQMVAQAIDRFYKIDVLVNNAGIAFDRSIDKITAEDFMQTIRTNTLGAFIASREIVRYMSKGSAIINVSSTNGTKTTSPECLDYNISKIGLQSLTRDLAFQFKPNIRVNAVAIGWADTDMNKDLPAEYIKSENERIYLGRFARPEEIANVIYFLASDEASYINGEIINIDGGYQ